MDHYVVCRINKLHTFGEIGAASGHNHRTGTGSFEHLNPTPEYENIVLKGSDDIVADVKKRHEYAEKCANGEFRKNAVLAVEMVLSASPGYFVNKEATDKWVEKNMAWLEKQYGDNCVNVVLHMDEGTPHLQLFIVPIDDRKKLNCRAFFGGKVKMKQLQDDSFYAVESLGILRGIPKDITGVEHQTTAEWREKQKAEEEEKASFSKAIENIPCITSNITNLVTPKKADYYYKHMAIEVVRQNYTPKLLLLTNRNNKLRKEKKELEEANKKLELDNKEIRKRNFELQQNINAQDKLIKQAYEAGLRKAKLKAKIKFQSFLELSKNIINNILKQPKNT